MISLQAQLYMCLHEALFWIVIALDLLRHSTITGSNRDQTFCGFCKRTCCFAFEGFNVLLRMGTRAGNEDWDGCMLCEPSNRLAAG